MIRIRKRFDRRFRKEHGFVTIEFVAGAALIIFPTMLIVTMFPTWFERVSMARVASREAARVLVLTADPTQATAAVQTIQGNYKLPDNAMTVAFDGDPRVRGGEVTATVSTKIPLFNIPFLGIAAAEIPVDESHTEVVDRFRSIPQ